LIRWGVIGCGSVTEVKSLPAFQKVDGFEVYGVTRRDHDKAVDYAKRHNVPKVYKNTQDLIDDPIIDAIYIATPPDSHKEYAIKVAQAGKICCIEKPMTSSYKDAYEVYSLFKELDIPLFISYYRRSLPRFLKVKEWIDDKLIGDIRHVHWHLHKPVNDIDISKKYNWRTDKNIAYGGYFDDVGSHGLNLIAYLLGDIVSVKGISLNQQKLYSAFDAISATWLHENGITGIGSWNFGSYKREDKVTIYGNKGQITFSALDEHPIVLETDSIKESLFIENPPNIQLFYAKNIKDYLDGICIHPSMGDSGLDTRLVMDKILGREGES
jgi:predicted dehydrogenase